MRVIYAPRSRRDLEKIRTFIACESKSDEVANRFLARILDACDGLSHLPARYPVYSTARTWRVMPFGNYNVLFEIKGNEVQIRHIRHAARQSLR